MTRILALDPGTVRSGWIILEDGVPKTWAWDKNEDIRDTLLYNLDHMPPVPHLVIEDVTHTGLAVGRDVFETVKWMGRFDSTQRATFISRHEVVVNLCGKRQGANDSTVRQALIDRFGGEAVAIGGKKCRTCGGKGWVGRGRPPCTDCHCDGGPEEYILMCGYETHPGPLHGISNHVWSALAVGLTYIDREGATA